MITLGPLSGVAVQNGLVHTPNSPPEELAHLARDRSPAELVLAERRREELRRLVAELPDPQAEGRWRAFRRW